MKKPISIILTLVLFCFGNVFAQKLQEKFKAGFPFQPSSRNFNPELTRILGFSKTESAIMDGTSGKIIWHLKHKSLGVSSIDYWNWNREAGVLMFYTKDSKNTASTKIFIDQETGKELWKTDQYGTADQVEKSFKDFYCSSSGTVIFKTDNSYKYVKLRTGEVSPDDPGCYLVPLEDGISLQKRRAFGSSINKPQIINIKDKDMKLTLTYESKGNAAFRNKAKRWMKLTAVRLSDGKPLWTGESSGNIVRTLCADFASSGSLFGGDLISLEVIGDKAFVMYEGISCFDLNTGKLLWDIELDNSDLSIGLKAKQTLGTAGDPVVTKDAIYVVDLRKGINTIKKLDLNTGRPIWESAKFSGSDVVPAMMVIDNLLVCQFGGLMEAQEYIPGMGGNPDVCRAKSYFTTSNDIKAYDIYSGKLVWQSSLISKDYGGDKFSKSITTLKYDGKSLYVSSEKNLFSINPASGKPNYIIPLGKLKIGEPTLLVQSGNKLFISATQGVAAFNTSDGTKVYVVPAKANLGLDMVSENVLLMWTGKKPDSRSEFSLLDYNSGRIFGVTSNTFYPYFDNMGKEMLKFDGNMVYKYLIQ
jgi:outer membrane protein assembly factor BamB